MAINVKEKVATQLEQHESEISTLQTNVGTAQGDITKLKSDVSTNTANIATNKTNITTNTNNISSLTTRVGTVETNKADKTGTYDTLTAGTAKNAQTLNNQQPSYYLDWNNTTNKPQLGEPLRIEEQVLTASAWTDNTITLTLDASVTTNTFLEVYVKVTNGQASPTNQEVWNTAGITIDNNVNNTLKFTCKTVPTADIPIYILNYGVLTVGS